MTIAGKATSRKDQKYAIKRFGVRTLTQLSLVLLTASMLGFAGGCLSVPNVSKMIGRVPASDDPPRIVSPRGSLAPEQSGAVMKNLRRSVPATDMLDRYLEIVDSYTDEPLTIGNKVTLLVDDPAVYAAMIKAIENAKHSVNVETFFIDSDRFGRGFADLLIRKQKQGVQVNLIYDRVGSQAAPETFFKRLRDAGVNVVEFFPVKPPWNAHRGLHIRLDHRKILVVDGTLAIIGGTNISEGFFIDVDDAGEGGIAALPWRDTDVQIEGPAVARLQRLFLHNWARQNGPELSTEDYFPLLKQEGDTLVRILANSPGEHKRLTFVMYVSAISCAARSIHITAAYFVPDKQIVDALANAARRGVDVKLVLPLASNYTSTIEGGQFSYSRLLKAGVKLYERRDAVLHAKTAVIDGVWSTVGSTNMDNWSFLSDDEVNAVILDRQFAEEMEALFKNDLRDSDQILLSEWRKRPFLNKLNEWFTHLFAYWL
jgi:cardiolipin synthase